MEIRAYATYNEQEILNLYGSVGWTSYTDSPAMLRAAFGGSLLVLGAFEGKRLIGLIRAVGDGASIVYVQVILVHPEYRRRGVGTALLQTVMERYQTVYQMCLMTDASEETIAFYRSCGFTKAEDMDCCGFMRVYRA